MGQIKNIKLHIVTDIKNITNNMAAAAVALPVATPSLATKTEAVIRHKDTVRVSTLTNRPINAANPPKPDIYWCEPCKIKLTNPLASLKHFTSQDHAAAAKRSKQATIKPPAVLKRKQDPKVSAPPPKVAKGGAAAASGGGAAAAAAKKKPNNFVAPNRPSNYNVVNSKRGGANARPFFNNGNNNNNNKNNNNQRGNLFQNNQRNNNFNNNRNMSAGGFNLMRHANDNSYPGSYIRESAGLNNAAAYTWQQQQQPREFDAWPW